MLSGLEFSVQSIWMIGAAVFGTMLALILGFKLYYRQLKPTKSAGKNNYSAISRTKYRQADVFMHTSLFFKIGLVLTLALVVAAMNVTKELKEVYIPENALALEEDIEIDAPRSDVEPPPPPPPPPSVIEEVPSELIPEDEAPEFVDQSVTEETVIEVPVVAAPAKKEALPPPPPPPAQQVEEIFKIVEEMPMFAGCEHIANTNERKACADARLLEFIYGKIQYPAFARENNIEGMVVIQFVVNKTGKIIDAKIVRDIGGGCGEEALRVVRMMPDWMPGKQRGREVNVSFNLPIRFELKGNQS